jgi:hypothetical protein
MKKRLYEYLSDLEQDIEDLSRYKRSIRSTLYELLSADDKSFEVHFKGHHFDFYIPTTPEEQIEIEKMRFKLIDLVMSDALITGDWSMITIFAEGVDPIDFQVERVDLKDLYEVTDENGEIVTALPLNEDAHVVKVQRLKEDNEEYSSSN